MGLSGWGMHLGRCTLGGAPWGAQPIGAAVWTQFWCSAQHMHVREHRFWCSAQRTHVREHPLGTWMKGMAHGSGPGGREEQSTVGQAHGVRGVAVWQRGADQTPRPCCMLGCNCQASQKSVAPVACSSGPSPQGPRSRLPHHMPLAAPLAALGAAASWPRHSAPLPQPHLSAPDKGFNPAPLWFTCWSVCDTAFPSLPSSFPLLLHMFAN